MDEERIKSRLQMHILNLCLATAGKQEGAIKDAKEALEREVVRIAFDASNGHLLTRHA